MSLDPNPRAETAHLRGFKLILLEAALVAVIGLILSLAANQVSPRRLLLTKNYFPDGSGTNSVVAPRLRPAPVPGNHVTNPLSAEQQFAEMIKAKGLQVVDCGQAEKLFRDPRCEQGIVVFLDARDEAHYRAGHIPGAYECDPYRTERHFPTVFPVCQMAEEIVVYCNGGECEDSQFAAIALRDAGVEGRKFFIFTGGMANWVTNGLPVEIGERLSGHLTNAVPGASK